MVLELGKHLFWLGKCGCVGAKKQVNATYFDPRSLRVRAPFMGPLPCVHFEVWNWGAIFTM